MHVTITGRNIEVTPALSEYAREKVNRIERYLHNITSAHIILTVEKYRHIAETTIQAHGLTIKGSEETGDMYTSIDGMMDKIEKQAKKLKDKIKDHNRGVPTVSPPEESTESASPSVASQLPGIVKTEAFAPKPMSVDEAAMQLHLDDDLFLVFLNAKSNRVNVIYKKNNGNLGLIEPQ
jgi:putative sigma-54 modulation protein